MYKLEITLRQHTPLIHFQHDQEGATLRATEIKSRLNNFVKSHLNSNTSTLYSNEEKVLLSNYWKVDRDTNGEIIKEYLSGFKLFVEIEDIGKGKKWFYGAYSPKIAQNIQGNEEKIARANKKRNLREALSSKGITWDEYQTTAYFANNATLNDLKIPEDITTDLAKKIGTDAFKLGVKHTKVKVSVFSLNAKLRKLIVDILPHVFFHYNFGTRQNKGFGCFLPEKFDINSIKYHPDVCSVFKINPTIQVDQVLSKIQKIYLQMKGGQRENGSDIGNNRLISQYFYNKTPRIAWEKPNIKKELKRNQAIWNAIDKKYQVLSYPNDDDTTQEFRYVRALLGLAELYEYKAKGGNKIKILIEDNNTNNEMNIQRFASPLTFKYDGAKIYLIIWKVPQRLLDTTFDFILNAKVNNAPHNGNLITGLAVPNQLDLTDFVDFALQRLYPSNFTKVYQPQNP